MFLRSYLEEGYVESKVHFFGVPKGEDDIRVVFDGTSSGLNECLWAPNFYLPTSRAASTMLTFSTWMADADFGEMFHNFPMPERIRKSSGVDTTQMVPFMTSPVAVGKHGLCLLRWSRLFMGMRPSPYNAVRFYYWGEEFIRGNPSSPDNATRYDRVILNLPCMETYDPRQPKVMKWSDSANNNKGAVAGDFVTFVDDCRITGWSKESCHDVHHQFASRVQFLGMQDAPRKFRPPSQTQAGAWTGTIFRIDDLAISKSVTQEKWDKGRGIISNMKKLCDDAVAGRPLLNHKDLERTTGFLNHLSMTFEEVTPFLKGFYLTLNSWRPQRDQDDWKMSDKRWEAEGDGAQEVEISQDANVPAEVLGSTRLGSDVAALAAIFSPEVVPRVSLRSKKLVTVVYGFGDASGTGLGATFTCGSGFNFRIGVWGASEQEESSNWKEFSNVVEALEDEAINGNLDDTEVFMFTDNSTVEACATRGSSSSPKLLELIIRLRALSIRCGIKLHIFHVAGTRMIAQGTDGVSRGFLALGVMAGEAMSAFIPIHKSARDRSPDFIKWIKSWSGEGSLILNPMDWFEAGHDTDGWAMGVDGFERPELKEGRTYIWSPPPYAADVALAELRKARIKRQTSSHVFVCPRLCCPLWLKQLYKASDVVLEFRPGSLHWPEHMHEPVLIGLIFPFLRHPPWQLRNTPKMHAVGRQLRALLEGEGVDARDFLRKFWSQCHRFRDMPETMVRKVLYFSRQT
ncbi:hypothetical protein MHU86_9030 [Fragilaria crotonensis]|nr:hypothetical protein MHU86_9030 [Fragilaria crotonensis]